MSEVACLWSNQGLSVLLRDTLVSHTPGLSYQRHVSHPLRHHHHVDDKESRRGIDFYNLSEFVSQVSVENWTRQLKLVLKQIQNICEDAIVNNIIVPCQIGAFYYRLRHIVITWLTWSVLGESAMSFMLLLWAWPADTGTNIHRNAITNISSKLYIFKSYSNMI